MKVARWIADGPKISARRIARGLTSAELARRAGIALRTLGRYENLDGALGDLEHLRAVARVLHVSLDAIARPGGAPLSPAAPSPHEGLPSLATFTALPERILRHATTQLETMVALEARVPPPRAVVHDKVPVPVLTARKLQNIFTAFAAYEGEHFAVVGVVAKQRGASALEAEMIQSRLGLAARFLLLRQVTDGVEIKVTVHTAKAKETRSLQKAFEEERETCAIVKVCLAPAEAVKEGKGFEFFLSSAPLAWGLVVVAVV